jgi:NADH-ubiquinone oxidoreductase chain 1
VAETNRAPFDLAEAESELVSGFMTEHAAVIFVFFFLAEYASIVLMCVLISILFLGGYLYSSDLLYNFLFYTLVILDYLNIILIQDFFDSSLFSVHEIEKSLLFFSLEGFLSSFTLGIKTSIMVFTFIWVRASFPRIRFDQLMSFC